MSIHSSQRPARSMEAVVKLREVRNQEALGRLLRARREIVALEEELRSLARRKDAVIRRGGERILRDRVLLDALTRIAIGRRRSLTVRRDEVAALAREYVSARGRLEAARNVETRRRRRHEATVERRADQASGDMASQRSIREEMEEPCAESGD